MKKKLVMGIFAHVDAGKTTLSESLLYRTGVIKSEGRVDRGDTFLDTDDLERERGITIYSKNARIPLKDKEIVLIDTPGHVDFATEAERTMQILDAAVLMVDASGKVQTHTKTLWALLKYYNIPVYIFVNKIDMPGFDKKSILESIKKNLTRDAIDFSNDSDISFYENIALCSEKYLNDFLNDSIIEKELIKEGIKERKIFPVFFASALKGDGMDDFLEGFEKYLIEADTAFEEELSAFVYKISYDNDSKRLTHLKILSGTLHIKDLLGEEKVNEIRIYSGSKFSRENVCMAGDVCVISGLTDSKTGMFYGKKSKEKKEILMPVLNYSLDIPKDTDIGKMLDVFLKLSEEDPSMNVSFNEFTNEISLSLMGEVQTQVIKRKVKDDHGFDVTFKEGKIRYKETISDAVIGVGHFEPLRHYAEVQIKMEPAERGSGLEFESELSEDLLDTNWQKLVLTHLREKDHKGVLTGSSLTDIRFTLIAGRAHNKHTEGGDFRQAVYRAVRQGLMKAKEMGKCVLLEPFYDYTLVIPSNYAGRAVSDINALMGTAVINENDNETGNVTIIGKAPVSVMNSYSKEIQAYSKGRGKIIFNISGYDECHNSEEVIEETGYDPNADIRNPSSSVFCSHGSGTVIEWFDVDRYKHTVCSEDYKDVSNDYFNDAKAANRLRMKREQSKEEFISVNEVDSIIKSSSFANENGRKSAYKGISSAMRERNRVKEAPKEVVYKGSEHKEKYLLVDGYNVIHAWKDLNDLAMASMDSAAAMLNEIMSNFRQIEGIEVIVVYDAYRVEGHRTSEKAYDNITVVYTKEAQTADQYIERYAHQNSKKYDITVATSDGMEQIIVTGAGCNIISSREFEEEVKRKVKDFNEKFNIESV